MKRDKYMGMLCEAPNYVELVSRVLRNRWYCLSGFRFRST